MEKIEKKECCFRDVKDKNILMLMGDIKKLFHTKMKSRISEDSKMVTYRPILHMLERYDGCTQLDIVNFTLLKAPTISLTLKNMESDDLIVRKEGVEDKRNVNIFLTEKGKELNRKMRESAESLKDQFIEGITEEEQEYVKDILIRIIKNAEVIK